MITQLQEVPTVYRQPYTIVEIVMTKKYLKGKPQNCYFRMGKQFP